ncbi:unnamed protein product [Orchesella dallaii]|uniref:ascorbate ferrireductase (transmembrane) n=1 Tax=Orchesella dallaii TaxID=48710 RepID=A0ABP1QUL2_9HEXA
MNTSHRIATLLLILWMKLSPHEHCASQSPDDPMVNSICIGNSDKPKDYYTLGQRPLSPKFNQFGQRVTFIPLNSVKTHKDVESGNEYPSTVVLEVKIYAMTRGNTGNSLAGWLFINIIPTTYKSKQNHVDQIYAQMEDDNGNAVGEFQNIKLCSVNPPFQKEDVDDFFTPCGQVAPSAAKVSNSILWMWWSHTLNADMQQALYNQYSSSIKRTSGINLVWKLSHTSCNKPMKIRLRAYMVAGSPGGGGLEGTHRSAWIKVNWVGAGDILQAGETAQCKAVLLYKGPIDIYIGNVKTVPWIETVEPPLPVTGGNTRRDIVRTKMFCKAVRFRGNLDVSTIPSFAGRCLKHDQISVSSSNKHECHAGATADGSFMKYSEYLEKRMNCMKISRCPCQCRVGLINNASGMESSYYPVSDSDPQCSKIELGVKVDSIAGKSILETRKAHGIAMLIVTMVFVPFNILISRYFKETWLDHAQLRNVQIWYLVHLAITYMTICLYAFGLVSLRRSNNLLGKSLLGSTHRHLGWSTVALFILATATGPIRPVSSPTLTTRKLMMISHALLGIIYYCLGMAALITSSWIPGSPSSSEFTCLPSALYFEFSSYAIMPRVVTWIVMDLGFHIIYMLLLCWADTNLKIQRSMYLPLLSILKTGGGHHDMKGFRYRKLILIIYSVCNGGIVLDLLITLIVSTKAGCGFGPTDCIKSSVWSNRTGNISSCGVI